MGPGNRNKLQITSTNIQTRTKRQEDKLQITSTKTQTRTKRQEDKLQMTSTKTQTRTKRQNSRNSKPRARSSESGIAEDFFVWRRTYWWSSCSCCLFPVWDLLFCCLVLVCYLVLVIWSFTAQLGACDLPAGRQIWNLLAPGACELELSESEEANGFH
jgi:hypothetical protein